MWTVAVLLVLLLVLVCLWALLGGNDFSEGPWNL